MMARRLRDGLLAGAALSALLTAGAAAQQGAAGVGQQPAATAAGRLTASSWSVDLRATYSTNFRRLPERLDRRVTFPLEVQVGEMDGAPVFATVPVTTAEEVAIDPPDNVIGSAVLSGGSVYSRQGLSAVLSGSLRVSGYADRAGFDERLEEELQSPIGPGVLPPGVGEDDILSRTFGLNDNNDDIWIRPNLTGSASLRLVDDLLFVDVSAIAQQQTISRRNDIDIEIDGRLGDQATYIGGSISPYLFREFADGGSVELRYRHSEIIVADEDFRGDRLTGGIAVGEGEQFSNDSVADELRAEFATGQLAERFTITLTGGAVATEDSGSSVLPETQFERYSGLGQLGYEVTPTFRLTASGGYDEISIDNAVGGGNEALDEQVANEFSGATWSAGFDWRPSQQTSLVLSYGERFGGPQIRGSLRYEPTPRLAVTAQANRDLGAGAQEAFRGFGFQNQITFSILNRLSGAQGGSAQRLLNEVLSFRTNFNGFVQPQAGFAVRDRFSMNASYTLPLTKFAAGVSYNTTEFFTAGETGAERQDNEIYGLNAAVSRQLGRRTTATASARYLRTQGFFLDDAALTGEFGAMGDGGGAQNIYLLSTGINYAVGRHLSLTGRVFHSAREGAEQQFRANFDETGVSAGVRWTF